jgi:DNA-binding Xre family transcriptional regulator
MVEMFAAKDIAFFAWDAEKGAKFLALRAKKPRKLILALLEEQGLKMLPETMRKIEYGEVRTLSADIFFALCKAYEVEASEILPCIKIDIPNSVFK